MNQYGTEIHAICPIQRELKVFGGPLIEAESQEAAELWCQENGMGYLKVLGRKLNDIPEVFKGLGPFSNGDN
ncbi:MAG: hypothetical protein HRU41_41345 [Saprospiraceae bacterium]|nr:hypothetical protein [Saprospiraceae bacterium]